MLRILERRAAGEKGGQLGRPKTGGGRTTVAGRRGPPVVDRRERSLFRGAGSKPPLKEVIAAPSSRRPRTLYDSVNSFKHLPMHDVAGRAVKPPGVIQASKEILNLFERWSTNP